MGAIAGIVLAASTMTTPVAGASGLRVTVVATPSLIDPGDVTTWKVTVTPSGGTLNDVGFFLEFNHTWAHIQGCSGGCQIAGTDAYWQLASLSGKKTVTAKVQIGPDGGNGPVTGRVYLSSGSCISGCPASDSVNYFGSATSTPKPKPKPTPKPTPRPTAPPTPKPTPKSTQPTPSQPQRSALLPVAAVAGVAARSRRQHPIAFVSMAPSSSRPPAEAATPEPSNASGTTETLTVLLVLVMIGGTIGLVGRAVVRRR